MGKRMARILLITLALALIAGALTTSASAKRGYTYTAMYGTPVVDGEIDDIWADAQDAHLIWNYRNGVSESVPLSRCHVFMMHDDTYLYVLAVIHDYSPSADDSLEIYLDEEATFLSTDQVDERFGRGNFPDYTYQLSLPVSGMSAFDINYGPIGAQCQGKTLVEDIRCKSIPNVRDSLGRYTVYQMEIKIHPVKAIPSSGNWSVEFMYNDINGNTGSFINALRWNCDTVTEDGNGIYDDFPYQSTISYAPLYFAAQGTDVTPDVPLYPVERQTDKPLETYHETETESGKVTETESEKVTETAKNPGESQTESGPAESRTETKAPETPTETGKEAAPSESGTSAAPSGDAEKAETKSQSPGEDPGSRAEGGCGSVLVSGAVLLVLSAAAGLFLTKKKAR